ncbi:hypothetical protein GCM10020218_035240 [Dactylosporangium vinaceum]
MGVSSESRVAAGNGDGEKQHRTTTDASASSDVDNADPRQKTKGHRRFTLNPLRWQKIPPVPEERSVSREYGASFLSKLFFEWMSPLMKVSILTLRALFNWSPPS